MLNALFLVSKKQSLSIGPVDNDKYLTYRRRSNEKTAKEREVRKRTARPGYTTFFYGLLRGSRSFADFCELRVLLGKRDARSILDNHSFCT